MKLRGALGACPSQSKKDPFPVALKGTNVIAAGGKKDRKNKNRRKERPGEYNIRPVRTVAGKRKYNGKTRLNLTSVMI